MGGIKILHRTYGVPDELQQMIDKSVEMISSEYEKTYPSLEITKHRLYSKLCDADYYEVPAKKIIDCTGEEIDIVEGGCFDPENRKMKINKLASKDKFDEHSFIHELTHSFLNIRPTFGAFLDEGLVDIQASFVGEPNGVPKSSAYPEERTLAKMLMQIVGEDKLLDYGTNPNTEVSFQEYEDITNRLRVKGAIAIETDNSTSLRSRLVYSMVDDLVQLFEQICEGLTQEEKVQKTEDIKKSLHEFIENENPYITSQNREFLQYFLAGLEPEKIPAKVIETRKENIKRSNENFKKLTKPKITSDSIIFCSGIYPMDENSNIYMLNEGEYTSIGWIDYEECTECVAFDKKGNSVPVNYDALKGYFEIEYLDEEDEKTSSGISESIRSNKLFKKTCLKDVIKVGNSVIEEASNASKKERENKVDDR